MGGESERCWLGTGVVGAGVRPDQRGLHLASVGCSPGHDAVGAILNAKEIQRRVGIVANGSFPFRTDSERGSFFDVETGAIHEELTMAADNKLDFIVLLVLVEKRESGTGLEDVH